MDTDGINWNIRPTINGVEKPNLYHLYGTMIEMYLYNGNSKEEARRKTLEHLREISKPERARPNRYDY